YWDPDERVVNEQAAKDPSLPLLDAVKPIILRNNRWRCDHGWDIDLDDGSSNYQIYNNLLLNGGLKFREGFNRRADNNILVRNTFHPHVWFENSEDVFTHNIVGTPYQPIRMPRVWGKEIDHNLLPTDKALSESQRIGCDAHSLAGDPMFVDPEHGDFTVKPNSPALTVGFKNFPMDQFGVTNPGLKKIARVPSFAPGRPQRGSPATTPVDSIFEFAGARMKNVTTLGERSAAGLPEIAGVIVIEAPADSPAGKAGLRAG